MALMVTLLSKNKVGGPATKPHMFLFLGGFGGGVGGTSSKSTISGGGILICKLVLIELRAEYKKLGFSDVDILQ